MKLPEIIHVPLREITRYARNPRKNAAAIPAVKASLKEFGWRQPMVIDSHNVIVIGDTRYQAACQLADDAGDVAHNTHAPCLYADDLTTPQIQALRLVDNKSHELAQWDNPLLKIELKDLPLDWEPIALVFSKEALLTVMQSVPEQIPAVTSPEEFPSYDESIQTQYCCPKCKYEWSGKPK